MRARKLLPRKNIFTRETQRSRSKTNPGRKREKETEIGRVGKRERKREKKGEKERKKARARPSKTEMSTLRSRRRKVDGRESLPRRDLWIIARAFVIYRTHRPGTRARSCREVVSVKRDCYCTRSTKTRFDVGGGNKKKKRKNRDAPSAT